MPHEYTNDDLALTNTSDTGPGLIWMQINNAITVQDEELNGQIEFQFPPVVKSDRKTANWKTIDQYSYEPVAYWLGSTPRAISMQWDYIVTSSGASATQWNIDRITRNLRNLKAYFYISVQENEVFPLVELKLYDYAAANTSGKTLSTWRMLSISISPSGPIIHNGNNVLHLKHSVTAELEMITQANPILQQPGDGSDAKIPSDELPKGLEIKKWF